MNSTANTRQEPTARDFKLRLSVPGGPNGHRPVTLFNGKYNGLWRGEIAEGVTAEVTRVGGHWQLIISRGGKSAAHGPVTTQLSPFEVCYFVDTGWLPGGPAMVFLTY
jgi:hypothetical protein